MTPSWLKDFHDSRWRGKAELWLDPNGNDVDISDATLAFDDGLVSYTWVYQGSTQQGSFEVETSAVRWVDSWHQPEAAACQYIEEARGLFAVEHSYSAPPDPDWGWRSRLTQRPDNSLVLQMTNIAPWGEEGRAVRMVLVRDDAKAK